MGLFPKLELNLASEFFRWVAIKKKKRFGCGEGSGGASQEGAQGNLCSLHSPPKGLPGRECFGAASPFFFLPPAALSLLPSQRALVLLYLLLALGFVILVALVITNTQKGENSTRNWARFWGERTSKRNKTCGSFPQCRRCRRRWPKPSCRARGATRQPGTTSRRSSTPSV